jgi:hypothetical protein
MPKISFARVFVRILGFINQLQKARIAVYDCA